MQGLEFRAWNKFTKEMLYPRNHHDAPKYFFATSETINNSLIPMLYTGLKDRNGKKKFKDDIIRSVNGRVWVIKHGHYNMAMPGTLISIYGWYMQDGECQLPISDGDEIIGNIHDNPELLEK